MQTKYGFFFKVDFKGEGLRRRQLTIFPWCECKYREGKKTASIWRFWRARHLYFVLCCPCLSAPFRFIVCHYNGALECSPNKAGLQGLFPGASQHQRPGEMWSWRGIQRARDSTYSIFSIREKFLTRDYLWLLLIINFVWRRKSWERVVNHVFPVAILPRNYMQKDLVTHFIHYCNIGYNS